MFSYFSLGLMLCILVMWGSGGKVVLSEQCLQLWITALICWVLAMICAGAWTLPTFYIFLNYINLRLNFYPLFPKKCMHRASPNFINSHIRLELQILCPALPVEVVLCILWIPKKFTLDSMRSQACCNVGLWTEAGKVNATLLGLGLS